MASDSKIQPSPAESKTPVTSPPYALHPLDAHSSAAALSAAKELLREYGRFVAAQPAIATFCARSLEQEAEDLPHSFISQHGGCIVASRNSEVASSSSAWLGFVAWRALPASELTDAWELKRLWIRPTARGLGLGEAFVQAVIDRARQAGKSRLLLDTAPESMASACRLYRRMGFEECEPYHSGPLPGIIFLSKSI
jgi:putative acetyltransferase